MRTKYYVGTSGWSYPWNPDGLSWYVEHAGLNAIELNMSFYRFPTASSVNAWKQCSRQLTWCIKVNRGITHFHRFSKNSFHLWSRFKKLFTPLNQQIAFFLFQLPPTLTPSAKPAIEAFFRHTRLKARFALEWRHRDWWHHENISWAASLGLTVVSLSAPDLPTNIINTSGAIYLRNHGRAFWYDYHYSPTELQVMAKTIKTIPHKAAYIFFNNDQFMLENAQKMRSLLT